MLEREDDLARIDVALEQVARDSCGRALLIEGPAGIGKTALIGELGTRAELAGYRVLRARGSERERGYRKLDISSRSELAGAIDEVSESASAL